MKQGATYFISVTLTNIDDSLISAVDKIIFTFEDSKKSQVQKVYPTEVTYTDEKFHIPLHQDDTLALKGLVKIEAQVNFKGKNVAKSDIITTFMGDTLATEDVDGNTPNKDSTNEIVLEVQNVVSIGRDGATFIPNVEQVTENIVKITWTNDGNLDNPDPVTLVAPKGEQGKQGEQGVPGLPGKDGQDGKNGATFTPTVTKVSDSEISLAWTNDKELPNPETVNITAPKGEQGTPGTDGTSFTWLDEYNSSIAYHLNDVVRYNGNAYICVSTSAGSTPDEEIDWALMVEKGAKGEKGDTGSPGKDGTNGTNGTDGKDGTKWFAQTAEPETGVNDGDLWLEDNGQVHIARKAQASDPPLWKQTTVYLKGSKGDTGVDGHTPVKGTDYWTEEDKTEIVNDVLGEMPSTDDAISSTSENPVQNKVIEKYLEPVLGKVQEQGVPTYNSNYTVPLNASMLCSCWYVNSSGNLYYVEFTCDMGYAGLAFKWGIYNDSLALFIKNVTNASINVSNVLKDSKNSSRYAYLSGYNQSKTRIIGFPFGGGFVTDNSMILNSGEIGVLITFTPVSLLVTNDIGENFNVYNITPAKASKPSRNSIGYNFEAVTPELNVSLAVGTFNLTFNNEYPKTPFAQLQDDVESLKSIDFEGNGLIYTIDAIDTHKTLGVSVNTDSPLTFTNKKLDIVSGSTNKKGVWSISESGSFKLENSTAGNLGLKSATTSTLGGVKIGEGLSVNDDGTISTTSETWTFTLTDGSTVEKNVAVK